MAEMLVQSENLVAIADKIRVLSGTEDAMTTAQMETHVDDANTNVATEADLIAQITSALEGKAASGGSDTPTNVTLNFSWTATSSSYRPEVFYSFINTIGEHTGNTYVASSTTSGSTTLTVAKNSIMVIVCKGNSSELCGVTNYSTSDGIVSLHNSYSSVARYHSSLFLINNNGQLTVGMGFHESSGGND